MPPIGSRFLTTYDPPPTMRAGRRGAGGLMGRKQVFNVKKFSSTLALFTGETPLRTLAKEIGGVSASTLSRIGRGEKPDIETFGRICRWLRVPEGSFFDHE